MIRVFNINRISVSENKLEKWFNNFPNVLKERIDKKGNIEKRKVSIIGYAMLQRLIKRRTLPLITFNENGKPYIEGRRYFNISNSGDMIVIAYSWQEVGVDIQKIFDYDERLANRICSESELEELKRAENKNEFLTRLWTIKESIVKCEGQSLAQDLKKINMDKTKYKFKCKRIGEHYLTLCKKLNLE